MKLPNYKKYPKKIYCGNECYKIIFQKNFKDYGETDPEKQTIKIKAGMSPRETLSTLVHELLHVLEFERNIKLSHSLVYELEEGIIELLLDNFL